MTAPDDRALFLAFALGPGHGPRVADALGPGARLVAGADGDPAPEAVALVFDMDAPDAQAPAALATARRVAPLAQIVFLGGKAALTRVRQGLLLVGGLRDQWTFLATERPEGWPALLAEARERAAARRALSQGAAKPRPTGGVPAPAPASPPATPPLLDVLAHISEAVFQLDLQGRIVYANAAARARYGEAAARPDGTLRAIVAPDAWPLHARALARVAAEGDSAAFEAEHVQAGGATFKAELSIAPLKDWRGQTIGVLVLARDLTPREEAARAERLAIEHRLALAHAETLEAEVADRTRELEEQQQTLEEQQQELEVALDELSRANERLRQADAHKDEFLSVISHELRTPLNFITGFASTLDDEVQGPLNAAQHEAMQKILAGADRMLALVDDLLDFARMQAGTFPLTPEPVDYGGLVADVLASLRVLADRKGLVLAAAVELDGPVAIDGSRIGQVLTNLVGNGIKFTDAGEVRVTARLADGELRTEVSDTGIGIAAADVDRLFGRFQQLDMSPTRKVGGSGLGLAISKSIVEAHGGRIGVSSEPGRGSIFWFSVPVGDGAV